MKPKLRRWIEVVVVGALALGFTAFIAESVFEHRTARFDSRVRVWMVGQQSGGLRDFFQVVSAVGAPNPMIVLSVAGALFLWWRRRATTAWTVLMAPAVAMVTYEVGKRLAGRARPPGGASMGMDFSFPSAHATASAAICCTLAYVFWQEHLLPGNAAIAFALLVPVLVGLSRLYLDVHWATDVLGGWSAGLLIASLSMALYHSTHCAS